MTKKRMIETKFLLCPHIKLSGKRADSDLGRGILRLSYYSE